MWKRKRQHRDIFLRKPLVFLRTRGIFLFGDAWKGLSIIAKIQTTQHGKLSACGEPGTLFGMKRTLGIALALLLCLSTGFAQDWAKQKLDKSPRHGGGVP